MLNFSSRLIKHLSAAGIVLVVLNGCGGGSTASVAVIPTSSAVIPVPTNSSSDVSALKAKKIRLNDTGISNSQCFEAGNNALVSCNSSGALALNAQQDGMLGRDALATTNGNTDGKLGFSYSTVENYPITDCVKDNVTGLIWEGKPGRGFRSDRGFDITFTNYDNPASPQIRQAVDFDYRYLYPTADEISDVTNSHGFMAAVNTAGLCGKSDWRIPTVDELLSLVHFGALNQAPAVDLDWFPNTQTGAYWSSTPYAGSLQAGWCIYFSAGEVIHNCERGSYGYVRLVRGG